MMIMMLMMMLIVPVSRVLDANFGRVSIDPGFSTWTQKVRVLDQSNPQSLPDLIGSLGILL